MTIGPSSHPLNTTGMPLNSTHILLQWHPPPRSEHGGVIREYRINVTEHNTGRMFQFTSEVTEITIGPLHPYYIYVCTIAAFTVDEGPYSDNVVVITHEDGKLHLLTCQGYNRLLARLFCSSTVYYKGFARLITVYSDLHEFVIHSSIRSPKKSRSCDC